MKSSLMKLRRAISAGNLHGFGLGICNKITHLADVMQVRGGLLTVGIISVAKGRERPVSQSALSGTKYPVEQFHKTVGGPHEFELHDPLR